MFERPRRGVRGLPPRPTNVRWSRPTPPWCKGGASTDGSVSSGQEDFGSRRDPAISECCRGASDALTRLDRVSRVAGCRADGTPCRIPDLPTQRALSSRWLFPAHPTLQRRPTPRLVCQRCSSAWTVAVVIARHAHYAAGCICLAHPEHRVVLAFAEPFVMGAPSQPS